MSEMTEQPKRPPYGVTPQFIWREQRIDELTRAIERYEKIAVSEQQSKAACSWRLERTDHQNWLRLNNPKEVVTP